MRKERKTIESGEMFSFDSTFRIVILPLEIPGLIEVARGRFVKGFILYMYAYT